MAVGDTVADIQSIATTNYLDILPGANVEWCITNIYHEADVELYAYDGTDNCLIDKDTGGGRWSGEAFYVNNTTRIRVKNTNASSKLIGYSGIITK
jgi:hypothetical protein